MEVTGKGRACIPGGLTKASRWLRSTYDYPLPTLDQMMNNLNGTMLYNYIINSCKSAYFSNGSCTNDSVESCNTNRSPPLRCSVLYIYISDLLLLYPTKPF